ncbi:MAG TPA: methyltransferase domain-containing protein [Polyangiaceae bacterium]|nr:methyltransferase domain-containing protein [Polyangiaceae bacterium]
MSVFGAYSRYYDLLYKDKDYAAEAAYVHGLIERHRPGSVSILDLGCGTGKHDFFLTRMGHELTGVDLSEEMLAVAAQEKAAFGGPQAAPTFVQGDVRSVRLGKTFGVVVSLFHVMSYQTRNEDLQQALTTIREHLKPGGLFLFDCWYGPAVLSDRPTVRIKRLEDENIQVTRLAEPVMHANENLVDVNYHVFIKDKQSGLVEELRETHTTRYFFSPEIYHFCEMAGLTVQEVRPFMAEGNPGFDSWNVVFLGTRS